MYNPAGQRRNRTEASILMERQKAFNILVALFLTLGVFNGSVLAEVCFCGSACAHSLQPTGKIKRAIPFHMRCPCSFCESCGLEKGQTLKASSAAPHVLQAKIHISALTQSDFFDDPSIHPILKNFEFFCTCGTVPSLPIYLKQLSLLC